jgi:hypothetical protein
MEQVKYPRVSCAQQLKPFKAGCISMFPMGTKIKLDKTNPVKRKQHCIIYQQGTHYGQVGDMCTYVSHQELFELAKRGDIVLKNTQYSIITF